MPHKNHEKIKDPSDRANVPGFRPISYETSQMRLSVLVEMFYVADDWQIFSSSLKMYTRWLPWELDASSANSIKSVI